MPLSEALYFYKNPGFLLLDVKAFLKNMQELKQTFEDRRRAEQDGEVKIKSRFNEILVEATKRLKERRVYW